MSSALKDHQANRGRRTFHCTASRDSRAIGAADHRIVLCNAGKLGYHTVHSTMAEEAVHIPNLKLLRKAFQRLYRVAGPPQMVYAPYRVCPLGAHIDHQGGTVLGMAIDRGVTFLWRPREDRTVRISSLDFSGDVAFSLDDIPEPRGRGFWGDYAAAAVWALRERKRPVRRGLDGVIGGTLPVGGLSSSAAVGLAYGIAFRLANDHPLEPWEVIRCGLRGENTYVGVNCGLLDFTTIYFAQEGSLVRIDCHSRETGIALPGRHMPPYTIGIVFSGVERTLARSGYNNRVSECRQAAAILGECAGRTGTVDSLIEITPQEYESFKERLPDHLGRRAEHFFSESARVEQGLRAWQQGRLDDFGSLVNESGASSVENYEAGCPEIIELWGILRDTGGVYGTRFSGGGFGGAVVALMDPGSIQDVEAEVKARYLGRYPACGAGFRIEFRSSAGGLRWGAVL